MSFVIKLNGTVFDNPDLPKLYKPLVAGAIAEWLFEERYNGDYLLDYTANSNHLDITGKALNSNGIVIPTRGATIEMPFYEMDSFTYVVAVKVTSPNTSVFLGTYSEGVSLFCNNDGALKVNLKGAPIGHLESSIRTKFILVSVSVSGTKCEIRNLTEGSVNTNTISPYNKVNHKPVFGGGVLGEDSYYMEGEFAYCLVANKSLTDSEYQVVHDRAKDLLAKRGINI